MINKTNVIKIFGFILVLTMVLSACGTKAPATAAPAKTFGEAACGPNCTYADMTLCYPQLGAESDWRVPAFSRVLMSLLCPQSLKLVGMRFFRKPRLPVSR
jgi:hypothetical protein